MKHSHRAGSPGPRTTPGMTATGIKALRDVPTALQPHRGDPPVPATPACAPHPRGFCITPWWLLHIPRPQKPCSDLFGGHLRRQLPGRASLTLRAWWPSVPQLLASFCPCS